MIRNKNLGAFSAVLLTVSIVALVLTPGAWAQSKYKTLYRFKATDGHFPIGVIFDQAGNLYGTTQGGVSGPCNDGCGTVFKLAPNSGGGWTQSVLYTFCSLTNCTDGAVPLAGLVMDQVGNLYGTTNGGGTNGIGVGGFGTVFKLAPNSDGSWTESVLYSFCSLKNCADGQQPIAGLIFDIAGNLYGTTGVGGLGHASGCDGCGVVFKLTPKADGGWTESVLHSFCSFKSCRDGLAPVGGMITDAVGNLYGTTYFGGGLGGCGADSCGVVFKLIPKADGSWKEEVLHRFTGKDGDRCTAGLIFDRAGNLYGTAGGGKLSTCNFYGCGIVFKLTPNSKGGWTETVLHEFVGSNGAYPNNSLIFGQDGNLYGTTEQGGNLSDCQGFGCGVVFKLAPNSKGRWNATVLHYFVDDPGAYPHSGVIFDAAGNLYGATGGDAVATLGSVFEITP